MSTMTTSYDPATTVPRSVTVSDGVEIAVQVDPAPHAPAGTPTVVLVHGFSLTSELWRFQREALRGGYPLVLLDQRGHGRSALPAGAEVSIERLGRDLGEVLEAVIGEAVIGPAGVGAAGGAGRPVVLVGHSMGGMAILALARQRPQLFGADPASGGVRVVGVGLVCSAAGDNPPGGRPIATFAPLAAARASGSVSRAVSGVSQTVTGAGLTLAGRVPAVTARARRAVRGVELALVRRMSFASPVPDAVLGMAARAIAETPVRVVADFYPAFFDLDLYDAVPVLRRVPTLVLSADHDRVTPPWQSEQIAARLPDARVLVLPRAGHLAFLEYPEQVSQALAELIATAAAVS